MDGLRRVGAGDQVAALLARDPAAHAPLDDPGAVARLPSRLREVGAGDQVTALADQLPAAGMFGQFLEFGDHVVRYRGREADRAGVGWACSGIGRCSGTVRGLRSVDVRGRLYRCAAD